MGNLVCHLKLHLLNGWMGAFEVLISNSAPFIPTLAWDDAFTPPADTWSIYSVVLRTNSLHITRGWYHSNGL